MGYPYGSVPSRAREEQGRFLHRRSHLFIILLLFGSAPLLTAASVKKATPTKKRVAKADTPAEDPLNLSSKSLNLLEDTRLEFKKLNLQMTGMATLGGEKSVFLKYKGSREQMMCAVGQVVGGFKIVSIQPEYTVFEGNGVQLWLASSPVEDVTGRAGSEEDDPEFSEEDLIEADEDLLLDSKESPKGFKTKTKDYAHGVVDNPIPASLRRPAESISFNGKKIETAAAASIRFMMPIQGSLSSPFGYRKQPTGGARKYHKGVDIQAPMKTPVLASAAGVVVEVSRSWAKGLNILIRHGDQYETAYFHLSKAVVSEGQKVSQGQLIGNEGVSGISTGPHLHFEIHKNGQPVDPSLFIRELAVRDGSH